MGETIDLNDLSNIEESFTNVKMYGGVAPGAKNNRDFQPGTKVLRGGDVWEFVKYDEKDSRYLIIKRDGEEIRVYNQSVVIYEPPPENGPTLEDRDLSFSPKSPVNSYQYSPGDVVLYLGYRWEVVKFDREDSRYVIIKRNGEEKRVYNKDIIIYQPPTPETPEEPAPRSPEGPAPRSPDGPAPRSPEGPKTPEEPAPEGPETPEEPAPEGPEEPAPEGPKTPEEPAPEGPKTPEEPAPETPEGPKTPKTPEGPKTPAAPKEDLITLLDSLQKENLPKIKLVKREELLDDSTREETGVYKATNTLLSRIHSEAREKYLRKFNELNELIKKNKGNLTFIETATDITKLGDGDKLSITKPIYRNIQELLSNLNGDLAAIEDELRQKRDAAIISPDPQLNKEIQELNETYKLYSQSLEIYHQYNSMVNKMPEKSEKMSSLLSLRNENRMEQIRLYSEIAEEMNKGAYDAEALNAKIQEYLALGTREIEGELRNMRESTKIDKVIINDYNVEETSSGTEEPKPKKKFIKKKKKAKKTKDELLTEVLSTLEDAGPAAEGAAEEAAPAEGAAAEGAAAEGAAPAEGAAEDAEEPAADGNYDITQESMIKGKVAVLDGKKQFKEEEVIREKCDESEECKGFTEKTYPDGKKKYFPRSTIKVIPAEDHKAFVKTGGATDLGEEVKQLLINEPEASAETEAEDPEIKVIKISQPGGSIEKEQNYEVEELNLGDDIAELIQEEEPEYSFGGSYESDENDYVDTSIPIEL